MIFFGFVWLIVVSAFVIGAYQAFTDKDTTPYIRINQPLTRIHPSLEYLDARRKAFEVHVPIDE